MLTSLRGSAAVKSKFKHFLLPSSFFSLIISTRSAPVPTALDSHINTTSSGLAKGGLIAAPILLFLCFACSRLSPDRQTANRVDAPCSRDEGWAMMHHVHCVQPRVSVADSGGEDWDTDVGSRLNCVVGRSRHMGDYPKTTRRLEKAADTVREQPTKV